MSRRPILLGVGRAIATVPDPSAWPACDNLTGFHPAQVTKIDLEDPSMINLALMRALREHRRETGDALDEERGRLGKYASENPPGPEGLLEHLESSITRRQPAGAPVRNGRCVVQVYLHRPQDSPFSGPDSPRPSSGRRWSRGLEDDERALCDFLEGGGADDLSSLRALPGRHQAGPRGPGQETLEILLIGDCLFVDVFSF